MFSGETFLNRTGTFYGKKCPFGNNGFKCPVDATVYVRGLGVSFPCHVFVFQNFFFVFFCSTFFFRLFFLVWSTIRRS